MNKPRDMPFPRKIPIGKVCEFLFDACLLAAFGIQAFVAGCLLIYGSLPLPPEWMNREISRKAEGFTIEAARYELTTKGKLVVGDLRVSHDSTEQPLLEADFLVAELSRGPSSPARPVIEDIVLSGARLYLPARHAPDGRRSVLLDKLSLRAKPSETGFEIDNVAALHEDIRLRGSVSWPRDLIPGEDRPKDAVPLDTGRFFRTVGEILQAKEKFDVLVRPTLQFRLSPHESGWLRIRATLSGRRLEHPALRGENLFVDMELRHDGNAMGFTSAPVFSASELESRQHPIRAANVTGTLERENWTGLQNGGVPPLAFASDRLEVFGVRLSDSRLDIDPVEYPSLRFRGTTSGLRGGAAVSGMVDLQRRKGRIEADGSLDLQRFLPSELAARLPELRFREIPDYRLTIDLGDDFSIDDARLQARVNDLAVNGVLLDHVHATLALDRDRLRIKRVHIDRGKQWIDFGYLLERETRSYDLTIRGSAVPTDYNPILPGWWSRLFEDFSFDDDSSGFGDFKIEGRLSTDVPDRIYGGVEARNVGYRGVDLDEGSLLVRSRERFIEISRLVARGEAGTVRGSIGFASKPDDVSAPASLRLDLRAQLAPSSASGLFGPEIASIIDDFQTEVRPLAELRAAIFHPAYPEYEGKDRFDLGVKASEPLSFRGIPFEHLSFRMHGRKRDVHLRDIRFGYAGGEGRAQADLKIDDDDSRIRFDLRLRDAEQARAIAGLPQLENVKDDLAATANPASAPDPKNGNRLDLSLRAEGPLDDLYRFDGYGAFEIRGKQLSKFDLLGPLSRALDLLSINFTSFSLDRMRGDFAIREDLLDFKLLEVNGPRTRVDARGILALPEERLDMRVSVFLLANLGDSESTLRRVGSALNPIPNLLEFELTGTIEDQKWRSLYDPRNLIPDALNPGKLIPQEMIPKL